LVETDVPASGEGELGDGSPSCLLHIRTGDSLARQGGDLCRKIVTHEVEFVPTVVFGGMNGRFRRGQGEDEPAMPGIKGWEAKDIAEKISIRHRILAVHDHMRARNHDHLLPLTGDCNGLA